MPGRSLQRDQVEEGELLELDHQPEQDNSDSDHAISEDQNYRETARGVHTFMGWSHFTDLDILLLQEQTTPGLDTGHSL